MKKSTQTRLLLIGLSLCGACDIAMAQTPIVGVYGIHYGGKVQYHYRVTNSGVYPISSVWVGHDTQNDTDPYNSVFELKEYPSGKVDASTPVASVTSPLGWGVSDIGQEETIEHSMRWNMTGAGSVPISVGQTLSGMSVTLDKMDSTYVTSHVTLYRWTPSLKDAQLTVPLQRLDVIAPSLTVTLTPNALFATNQLYSVTAAITVMDDYDPQPEIKLESIMVSEVSGAGDVVGAALGTDDRQFQLLGSGRQMVLSRNRAIPPLRVYTVTYSAMDGSGNKTLTSVTLPVNEQAQPFRPCVGLGCPQPTPIATPVVPAPCVGLRPCPQNVTIVTPAAPRPTRPWWKFW